MFATGSMDWTYGLSSVSPYSPSPSLVNSAAEQITVNVLNQCRLRTGDIHPGATAYSYSDCYADPCTYTDHCLDPRADTSHSADPKTVANYYTVSATDTKRHADAGWELNLDSCVAGSTARPSAVRSRSKRRSRRTFRGPKNYPDGTGNGNVCGRSRVGHCNISFDTTTVPDGQHTLVIKAFSTSNAVLATVCGRGNRQQWLCVDADRYCYPYAGRDADPGADCFNDAIGNADAERERDPHGRVAGQRRDDQAGRLRFKPKCRRACRGPRITQMGPAMGTYAVRRAVHVISALTPPL